MIKIEIDKIFTNWTLSQLLASEYSSFTDYAGHLFLILDKESMILCVNTGKLCHDPLTVFNQVRFIDIEIKET